MDERAERYLKLHDFIGRNSRRYCDIFEENENKKVFVHTNWAAFFFGPAWMFYRSMYAWGTLGLLANYIIAFISIFLVVGLYALGILKSGTVEELLSTVYPGICINQLIVRVVFSLFADCIYRAYVFKNLTKTEGGASFVGVILGMFLSGVIEIIMSVIVQVLAVMLIL